MTKKGIVIGIIVSAVFVMGSYVLGCRDITKGVFIGQFVMRVCDYFIND